MQKRKNQQKLLLESKNLSKNLLFQNKSCTFAAKFEKYTFEVGGASKSFDQIKNVPNSYLALDEIEYGTGNAIPLFLFGFLY